MIEWDEAVRRLEGRGWLAHQPPRFRAALLARARLRRFATGEVLFGVDGEPGGIFGAVSGGFALSVAGARRGPDLAHVVRCGTWFGMGPLMTRRRRVLAARAQEESLALHVPLAALDELRLADPDAARSLGAVSDFAMDVAIRCVSDLLRPRAEQRIASVLLRVTAAEEEVPPDHPEGWLLTQADLASMANASRQLANRTLAGFVRRGWIAQGHRRIRVLDVPALAALADADG